MGDDVGISVLRVLFVRLCVVYFVLCRLCVGKLVNKNPRLPRLCLRRGSASRVSATVQHYCDILKERFLEKENEIHEECYIFQQDNGSPHAAGSKIVCKHVQYIYITIYSMDRIRTTISIVI